MGTVVKPAPEPDVHSDKKRQEQDRRFDPFAGSPLEPRLREPGDQERRHEQDPSRIAEPPREPDGRVAPGRSHSRQRDRRRADARAHEACQERDGRELEDVWRPVEGTAGADQPVEQRLSHDGFQGVADPDHRRDRDGGENAGGLVGEEGHDVRSERAEHDSGPDAVA